MSILALLIVASLGGLSLAAFNFFQVKKTERRNGGNAKSGGGN